MKTIKKNLAILMLALFGLGIIGHNASFGIEVIKEAPPPGGGGSDDCNLCVVENVWGSIEFSCRPKQGVNDCEASHTLGSIYCENAIEC